MNIQLRIIAALAGLAALLGLLAVTHIHGVSQGEKLERAVWQKKELQRQQAEQEATLARIAENERTRIEQEETTRKIADDYERQIQALRRAAAADRAAVDRAGGLRIPRAVCEGLAGPAQAAGAGQRDEAAAGTVRLPPALEDDLWRLAEDADAVTEQARACQAWIAGQGFYGAP